MSKASSHDGIKTFRGNFASDLTMDWRFDYKITEAEKHPLSLSHAKADE